MQKKHHYYTVISKSIKCSLEEEKRGRHGKQKKLAHRIKEGAREHINSIQRVVSHYIRADSSREYFEGSLDLSTLYCMYVEKCNSDEDAVAKSMFTKPHFTQNLTQGFITLRRINVCCARNTRIHLKRRNKFQKINTEVTSQRNK